MCMLIFTHRCIQSKECRFELEGREGGREGHCRNCGGVFCNGCSDNNMQLAVSSKPVRVCDGCYGNLLERNS